MADGGPDTCSSSDVLAGEQRLLGARLKQYQLELSSSQAQLAVVHSKDTRLGAKQIAWSCKYIFI